MLNLDFKLINRITSTNDVYYVYIMKNVQLKNVLTIILVRICLTF